MARRVHLPRSSVFSRTEPRAAQKRGRESAAVPHRHQGPCERTQRPVRQQNSPSGGGSPLLLPRPGTSVPRRLTETECAPGRGAAGPASKRPGGFRRGAKGAPAAAPRAAAHHHRLSAIARAFRCRCRGRKPPSISTGTLRNGYTTSGSASQCRAHPSNCRTRGWTQRFRIAPRSTPAASLRD